MTMTMTSKETPLVDVWKEHLEEALRVAGRGDIVKLDDPRGLETLRDRSEEIHDAWVVGTIAIALMSSAEGRPMVLLVETCFKERNGSTYEKVYMPLKTRDLLDFQRIVRTASDTSIRLTERPGKRELPVGVLVKPDVDGFFLHVPLKKVNAEQLKGIIKILEESEGEGSDG